MHGSGWHSYISASGERPKITRQLLNRVFTYAWPYRKHIAGMLVMILISSGLTLIAPLIMRDLIDRTLPNRDLNRLMWLSVALLAVPLIRGGVSILQRRYNAVVGEGVICDLRASSSKIRASSFWMKPPATWTANLRHSFSRPSVAFWPAVPASSSPTASAPSWPPTRFWSSTAAALWSAAGTPSFWEWAASIPCCTRPSLPIKPKLSPFFASCLIREYRGKLGSYGGKYANQNK